MSETTEAPVQEAPAPEVAETPAPETTQAAPEPAPVETPEPPKEDPRDRRIRVLSAQKNDTAEALAKARERADELERRLAALERPQDATDAPQAPQKPAPGLVPQTEVDRRAEAMLAERQAKERVDRFLSAGNEKFTPKGFADVCNAVAMYGAADNPDFMGTLTELEHPVDVVHYLGTHDDEAERVAGLRGRPLAIALARIEAKVTAPPPPKPVSKAPAPLSTLDGGAGGEGEIDLYDADFAKKHPEKWQAEYEKRVLKKK